MKNNVLYSFIISVLVASIVMLTGTFFLEKTTTSEKVFNKSINSIVEIKAETENVGESFGTAVFVKDDGTMATNAHVVTYTKLGETKVFESICIRFAFEDDYRLVSLIKFDKEKDIAILKLNDINCKFKPISIGDSDNLNNGENVYAVGNLNNVGISITKGIVSNKKINVKYNDLVREVIQCDLTIADGNSGGALLNGSGELVGLTTFRLKDSLGNVIYGISYSVPINTVMEYIKNN